MSPITFLMYYLNNNLIKHINARMNTLELSQFPYAEQSPPKVTGVQGKMKERKQIHQESFQNQLSWSAFPRRLEGKGITQKEGQGEKREGKKDEGTRGGEQGQLQTMQILASPLAPAGKWQRCWEGCATAYQSRERLNAVPH